MSDSDYYLGFTTPEPTLNEETGYMQSAGGMVPNWLDAPDENGYYWIDGKAYTPGSDAGLFQFWMKPVNETYYTDEVDPTTGAIHRVAHKDYGYAVGKGGRKDGIAGYNAMIKYIQALKDQDARTAPPSPPPATQKNAVQTSDLTISKSTGVNDSDLRISTPDKLNRNLIGSPGSGSGLGVVS